MKAAVYRRYGGPDQLKLEDVPEPDLKPGKVLVRIKAASLNAADWIFLKGSPWPIRLMAGGLFSPGAGILGSDIAGIVERVGEGVTRFKPGDRVFGDISDCGRGGFAELASAPEDCLVAIPDGVGFEEAAAVPMGALTALQGLRDHAKLKEGETVLVHGASGTVGCAALQVARILNAVPDAVCSTRNVEQARPLGAERVFDYTGEDFVDSGIKYDVIFAVNGSRALKDYRRALNPGGRLMQAGGDLGMLMKVMLFGPLLAGGDGVKFGSFVAKTKLEDLETIRGWLAGGVFKPVIEKCYPFNRIGDAMRHFGVERARGKLIVTFEGS